jgi:peptidase C25-like protein
MNRFGLILLLICIGFFNKSQAQINSVLATGKWYKFAITESGIYEINGSQLESIGIPISQIDPAKISLFGNSGGMLPQANSDTRSVDLEEIAIKIIDNGDGKFDSADKIVFWGEGPDKTYYDEIQQLFIYENNFYSDSSFYFLNFDRFLGKRIKQSTIEGSYPSVDTYQAYDVHEVDQTNILKSGRSWYGEKFDSNLDQTFSSSLKDWVTGSTAKIFSSVMSSSFADSKFTITINGVNAGTQQISSIPEGQYSIKGVEENGYFGVNLPESDGSNIEINYLFEKQNGLGYLNYFLLQVEKNILLENNFSILTIPKKSQDISTLSATGISSSVELWNVVDFNNVETIASQIINNQLLSNINTDTTTYLVLLDPNKNLSKPNYIKQIRNQNVHGISSIDLLIVTAPEFLSQVLELKAHKLNQGIITEVVTTNQVYNEFSSGRQDVTAIRDFTKYLYENAGLKHLLLFGKGTYDYKNIDEKNNSYVPIYESRNSLSPLYSYGSDDYLGFMDEEEGEWDENLAGDHTLDIGVGRLPVKSTEDAEAIVNKIIKYYSNSTIGDWRKKIYFVAENGDFNIHQRDAERLSTLIDTTYSAFNPQKIYIDGFPIEVFPSTTKAPLVNEAIAGALESGAFIMNYTGHGNEDQWAKSNVFNRDMIDELKNDNFYPLIVTATCEFGRHDDANQISAGEELVIKPNAGAIGLITTSRPVFASSNYKLNLAFYSNVLATENGVYKTLGEIFKETKNNSLSGPNNRNFSLLADPSLKLAYPQNLIQLDSLNGVKLKQKDTIRALENVTFSGSLRNSNGSVLTSYNGEVSIKFFDKLTEKQTLGNFGAPFEYGERDNFFFSGKSTVTDGQFQFTFIAPLDISYQVKEGKVSMYSVATDSTDASGASTSIAIGGSSSNPAADTTPPLINLYMEDTTFQINDLVSANSLLIIHLYDESGINLSKSQIGHHTTYTLDNNEPISVNDNFEYDLNSYQSGKIILPLQEIAPGDHILSVKTWDVYNNSSTEKINFRVALNQEVYISDVSVFPNPISENATFTFKHNLSGNDISVVLKIINRSGQTIFYKEMLYNNSNPFIDDISWDGRNSSGYKLTEGIYIYNINIRSIDSGASNSFFGRLMTVN